MKITKSEIEKLNEGCGNGFKFDVRRYLSWGEKQLIKYIDIEKNDVLSVKIEYIKDKSGQIPTLSLTKWKKETSGLLCSDCKTQYINLGEAQKRKNFKLLKEYSNKITDDYVFKIHDKEITSTQNILF